MKNKDRDEEHRRRRGNESPEDEVDGREVAERLYGGFTDRKPNDPDDDALDE
jgi:hypothetical protein